MAPSSYEETCMFLRVAEGLSETKLRGLHRTVERLRGTPQKPVDWSDPDSWIRERLVADDQKIATYLWEQSRFEMNPRFFGGRLFFVLKHSLMETDEEGRLRTTDLGNQYLSQHTAPVVAEVDRYEGVLFTLHLVAELGPARRGDLLPDYTEYCLRFTGYRSSISIMRSLYFRLRNLILRGYVVREGQDYSVTRAGLSYLEKTGSYHLL